jgi:pyridoxal phosphate enzyme (YggS family)
VLPIDEPEITPSLIADRHARLVDRLREAARDAGRDPDAFSLVAVTKGFGIPVVRAAVAAGLTAFGENRVQEAGPKVDALPELDWHFIGRLQSNKVRRALALFGTVHSVDSFDLLARLDRIAHDDGRHPRLLLQVNLTGEERKAGFAPSALEDGSAAIAATSQARVVGLMTIGRFGESRDQARATFASLRMLRDRLRTATGLGLPELSMGMTADAAEAVAEGATLVRVGTALFGPRPD